MESCNNLVTAAASTLRSLDRKYKIFLETMHSTIESLERQYVDLLRSNSHNHTGCHISLLHANIFGLNSTIQILSIEISTAKLFEPLVNLSIILPDTNETCQLLSNAFHDLSTQITQVAQRINLKLLDALACDHRVTDFHPRLSSTSASLHLSLFRPPKLKISCEN
ncbi:hypothetical protein F5879DRAFT_994828 [Lentinula edodes]|nr:hypothetical protein F5879DRAFT_994828 [Lentinula edodes]